MGLKNFQIIFDNPWNTYYCGQPVSGRVQMTVDSAKKFRAIKIKLKGEAEVRFHETTQQQNSEGKTVSHTTTFTGSEIYFETKYSLVAATSTDNILPVGEHSYPFSSILPHNLPSSFEGEYGHVRYTVKVTVDRPWKFDNETKSAFTVINPLDLNLHPTARNPIRLTTEKQFGCCCCLSAPLSVTACIPTAGCVPGQQIPVTIEVDNQSNQLISNVTCQMMKNVKFHAQHPNGRIKYSSITVSHVTLEGSVNPNGSNTWVKQLAVPPLPPSNLTNCSIIDVEYSVVVVAVVSSCLHRNLSLAIPIVLGTIPLVTAFPSTAAAFPVQIPQQPLPLAPQPDYPSKPMLNEPTPLPSQPSAPQIGWTQPGYSLYPDLPPPNYEEATTGATNILDENDSEHVGGAISFTPRYPYYNFQPSAPPM